MLKLKIEELISKTAQLKQSSDSLLAANEALKLKTEELNRSHSALFESNHELALVNKELATTNKQFAETNKRFSEVNKELGAVNHELALANEQIKLHDNMLTEFVNIAAHELRTPTQSILGYSELLQQLFSEDENEKQVDVGNDNQTKKALEAILRNANRLERLAKDILDVTRIDSHRLILHKVVFDLNETIKDVIDDIVTNQIKIKDASNNNNNSSSIDDDNIKVIFKPKGAKDVPVEADKQKIYQVISNLLINAVKFTKEGTISITTDTTADKGGEVIVKVKDTGTGIPAHILPRLFSKFATGSSEGIGLGLYISKSIVEAHGGRMWAENNSNNDTLKGQKGVGGATFAFSLPNATN
ncbi:MAG TPA: HAMP domain-containing sensor histidine kinase, partial [Nitrososphaeraceae archaeon]|nr:HAMP domain-containing sensor histidine kinase [Nitrososphaeraceae archaeon]